MMTSLTTMRDAVCDEKSFVEFLEALSMDWSAHLKDHGFATLPSVATPVSPVWQSSTIGDFLDAAVRAGDSDLASLKAFERPPNHWHRVACILYFGKRYD